PPVHFRAGGHGGQQALKAIGAAFNAGLGEIAAQPQQVSQEAVKTKRSWLSRIFS
ncbi:HPr family phosphocarrier protein, partial [Staphylococcus aureus]|nr:HPr family phosphocarrier protein [Staphylococcus aureus]